MVAVLIRKILTVSPVFLAGLVLLTTTAFIRQLLDSSIKVQEDYPVRKIEDRETKPILLRERNVPTQVREDSGKHLNQIQKDRSENLSQVPKDHNEKGGQTQNNSASATQIHKDQGKDMAQIQKDNGKNVSVIRKDNGKNVTKEHRDPGVTLTKIREDVGETRRSYNKSLVLRGLSIKDIQESSVEGSVMDYLSNYKNPCWFKSVHGVDGFRCLPYFYQLGVFKSSTSHLYRMLTKHPDIVKPPRKELNFWSQIPDNRNLQSYIKTFMDASKQIYSASKNGSQKITFEATPRYFTIDGRHAGDASYTLPQILHSLNPQTKLLVIMRHPTDRLFSQYHFENKDTFSIQRFHQYVLRNLGSMRKCLSDNPLSSCTVNSTLNLKLTGLHYSMYYPYAREWLSVFPRRQMLFIKSEEFYNKPSSIIKWAFQFLDLDTVPQSVYNQIDFQSAQFQKAKSKRNLEKGYAAGMLNSTRNLLDDFFEPFNKMLADLLQDEKFLFRRNN